MNVWIEIDGGGGGWLVEMRIAGEEGDDRGHTHVYARIPSCTLYRP